MVKIGNLSIENVTQGSLAVFLKLAFCSHRYSDEYMLSKSDGKFRTVEMNSNMIHSVIDPMLLDSALGWYSNVFDLSRFMTCLMGYSQRQLLTPPMVCKVMCSTAHPTYGLYMYFNAVKPLVSLAHFERKQFSKSY